MKKAYCATLIHETSRWSPIPTSLDDYRRNFLYAPVAGEGLHLRNETFVGVNWNDIFVRRGHDAAIGLIAGAEPGRPTSAKDYAFLKDELLAGLRAAMPVDMVALFLHGAQVAEGVDDCNGDIAASVREIVGPRVPVGVVFDLHGNISDRLIENVDALVSCLEYPHTDFGDRAEQMVSLLEDICSGHPAPFIIRRRVPMLGTYFTTRSPMRELVDWARALEQQPDIKAVSITHGFAWSDVKDCGANVIVCATGDRNSAEQLADTIAARYFQARDLIRMPRVDAREAVAEALAHSDGLAVIADTADNPGGGAPGDSTHLLCELLASGADRLVIGMIWDPIAVEFVRKVGVGAELDLRIGGKTGPASGAPVDLKVKVLSYRDDAQQMAQGALSEIGPAALVAAGGVRIVLCARRQQVFDKACFEQFGVDVTACRVIVVKSHQHFMESFAPVASKVIYATPPGAVNMNYRDVAFSRIPRPIYPVDEAPLVVAGRRWS